MKNKKQILIVSSIVFLAAFAIGIVYAVTSLNTAHPLAIEELLPHNNSQVQFSFTTLSTRSSEEGKVTNLLEISSEQNASLASDALNVLKNYNYQEIQTKVSSGEFISVSFAYSETQVTRLELYSDGCLLLFSETDTAIYRAIPTNQNQSTPFGELYEYITGEPLEH